MISHFENVMPDETEHAHGGDGTMIGYHLVDPSLLKGKAKIFKLIELAPGSSIGPHSHVTDFEVYYILEGEGEVDEGNGPLHISAGDTIYTADGATHSIACTGKAALRFIACIVNE